MHAITNCSTFGCILLSTVTSHLKLFAATAIQFVNPFECLWAPATAITAPTLRTSAVASGSAQCFLKLRLLA